MTGVLLATWLLSAEGTTRSPSAEEVAAAWLEALSRSDVQTLRQMTTLPFVAEGFQNNTRASENICDRVARMRRNPTNREIHVSAASDAEIVPVLACLVTEDSRGEWTKDGIRPTITLLRSARDSSRRLARYRPRLRSLDPSSTLVQAIKEWDAITVSALLVLRPRGGSFAVSAFYLDFLFEE
jgi:hypothetical protein